MSAAPTPPDLSRLRIAADERAAAAPPPARPRAVVVVGVAVVAAALAGGGAWLARGALSSSPVPSTAPPAPGAAPTPGAAPRAAADNNDSGGGGGGAILAGGRVESSGRRELSFAGAGVVGAVHVVRGQNVKPGDVLVELEGDRERAAVAERRAALDAARARLQEIGEGARVEEIAQAQSDADGALALAKDAEEKAAQAAALVARGAVTRAQEQEAAHNADAARARVQAAQARLSLLVKGARRTALSSAEADVARARAALAQAEADLAATRLVAPIDGTVVEVRAQTGEATGALAQAPAAVVITDLAHLEVRVDVPEAKALRVRRGARAQIVVEALPGDALPGRVVDVGVEADRQKGTLEVIVAFDAPGPGAAADLARVRPRMAARVEIEPASAPQSASEEK